LLLLALAAAFLTMGPQRGAEGDDPPLHLAAIATPDTDGTPHPTSPVEFVWRTRGGPNLPLSGTGLLTIAPDGNLWIPDADAQGFQIFSPNGDFLEAWGTEGSDDGQFNLIASGLGYGAVAFDAEGNIYVADTGNRRIQKFDTERRFITSWGTQGAKEGQFLRPLALAIDGDGRVFVADDLRADIQVFDSDGAYLATWGGRDAGDGRLNGPSDMTFDAAGNLWVADYNNDRIVQFSPDGDFLTKWGTYGSEAGELFSPSSLAVDDQGRAYVAEFGNYRVQVFDNEGRLLTTWGESGRGEGQFDGVYGIVLDHDGNVYVSEVFAQRVQKFRLLPPLAP
jgi:DNA-binding beta-propeller fold protein YncE